MKILQKYEKRVEEINSFLCIGLDADISKIPKKFLDMEFPQFEFNKYIIEETHEYALAYKPNSAFYEAMGDKGVRELKMTIDYLNKNYPDILTILDAKRGDIGNTNNGYVQFAFDWLGFDAITIYPYLGKEAIQPFLDREDKSSIILCRTSNPGAKDFQDLKSDGRAIFEIVADRVAKDWNKNNNCMLVVGATYINDMKKIREIAPDMIFLVPGVGAQGGSVEDVVKNGKSANGKGLIINSSRSIIFSENPKQEAEKLCQEIRKYTSFDK